MLNVCRRYRSDGTKNTNPVECALAKWELHARFWGTVAALFDPQDYLTQPGSPGDEFYDRRELGNGGAIAESLGLVKKFLGVDRLSFDTYLRVRQIFREALLKAKTEHEVDVALCAAVVFIQLELGGIPNPEYGQFPEPEQPWNILSDGNLSEDDALARAELEYYDEIGTSEYGLFRWFREWHKIVNDAGLFEEEFPGKKNRRAHLAQALEPIFVNLYPIHNTHILEMCLNWARQLLQRPLEETRLPIRDRPVTEETQLPIAV